MNTLANTDLDDVVIFHNPEYKRGTVVGIGYMDGEAPLYLIGYYEGQPYPKDAWTNQSLFFPNFNTAESIGNFKHYTILEQVEVIQ